jgi:hypothetical protein
MRFRFIVDVEVEREEGLFASREDLGEQMREEIEGADPGSLEGENGGTYSTVEWEVSEGDAADRR